MRIFTSSSNPTPDEEANNVLKTPLLVQRRENNREGHMISKEKQKLNKLSKEDCFFLAEKHVQHNAKAKRKQNSFTEKLGIW